eukprot:695082-Alexandrium_andersonii.AAC.1
MVSAPLPPPATPPGTEVPPPPVLTPATTQGSGVRSESQEMVLVGMVSAGPTHQQPRQASPGQRRQQQE